MAIFEIPHDEVDAEFEELPAEPPRAYYPEPQPVQQQVQQPDFAVRDVVRMNLDVSANPSLELALYEKRARAVTLFVKVPFLAYLSLNDRLPAPVRLGAALLAVWEASQIVRTAPALEETMQEWVIS